MKLLPILSALLLWANFSPAAMPRLKVSENHRFLITEDGRPFFWLGDTAWELFHRLNREDAGRYLDDRARKGFTIIQAVAIAELDGATQPPTLMGICLNRSRSTRPDVKEGAANDYWDHVDYIVRRGEPAAGSTLVFFRLGDATGMTR